MIEICLNPDNTTLGGEVFESVDSDVHAESRDSQEMALRTADKLLKELKPKGGQQQMSFQLLQGMLQLATKNKVNTEHDPLKLKCFLSKVFLTWLLDGCLYQKPRNQSEGVKCIYWPIFRKHSGHIDHP